MTLFQQLYDLCVQSHITIATSESCTAGLLAARITSVAGASSFFKGGVIAYQNQIKIDLLAVSEEIISKETEVCAQVVEQMAQSVRVRFSADYSIATSGYAGPSGGNEINPVGTVFIAISSKQKTMSKRFLFMGDRQSIVMQAVNSGAALLINELKNQK